MVRISAFNQSVTRLATPFALTQQLQGSPARQPNKPAIPLILVDGIVGPVQQGSVSGAFYAYSWTMNNAFTWPRTKATSVQTFTNAVSRAPLFFSACASQRRIGKVRYVFPQYSPTQMEVDIFFGVVISQVEFVNWGGTVLAITFNFASTLSTIRQNSELIW